MNLIEAFRVKSNQIKRKVTAIQGILDKSHPRPPYKLKWLLADFATENVTNIPQSRVSVFAYMEKNVPLDKLARTFCDMEAFEIWLDKLSEGQKRHQLEMEKQAGDSILKLKSFAAFCEPEKDGVPF